MSDSATAWAMVRCDRSHLENKTNDGSIHNGSKTFTWCDKNTATNGGNRGVCGTGTGNAAMDTEAFIKALNDAKFGGFSDWRMPNIKELESILDMGDAYLAFNPAWFPNTVLSCYLSATTKAVSSDYAWCVGARYGNVSYLNKTYADAARAVRGGQSGLLGHLVDNGDGTVTDTDTGLMWQKEMVTGKTWDEALKYAEGLSLARYNDWRLPTLKELQSIVNYSHYNLATDTAFFPGTLSSDCWSSSTNAYWGGGAWGIDFDHGDVYGQGKMTALAVRAVRGGRPELFGDVDMNGAVNLADAILALQTLASLKTVVPVHREADVDGDNKIGMAEAIYVLQSIARLRNNHSPALTSIGNKTVDESSTLTFSVSATDSDGGTLAYSATPLPSGATFNARSRTFTWTPTYSQSEVYAVTFTVSDGYGGTDSETIIITVIDKLVIDVTECFPLHVGDWQDYISTGITSRTTVSGTKSVGGYTAMIRSSTNGNMQYYSSDQNGIKYYGQYSASNGSETLFNTPLLLMPNNSLIGTSTVSTSKYSFLYSGYTYNVNITSTTKILGLEDVQTANRTLKDCVRVSLQLDQYIVETGQSLPGETAYYWIYKGVGSVKTVVGSDTQIISGSYVNGVQQTY
ncbi:MAG: Lcl domain-containing protein [Syntrophales bacterium]